MVHIMERISEDYFRLTFTPGWYQCYGVLLRTRKWVYLVHGGELQGPCRVHVTLNASLAQQALSQCCSAVRRGNTKQCKEMEVWCNGVCNAWTVWCFWCTWCIMAFVVYASEPAGMNIPAPVLFGIMQTSKKSRKKIWKYRFTCNDHFANDARHWHIMKSIFLFKLNISDITFLC